MKLKRRKTIKSSYASREFSESFFIPYESLWDSNTVLTKDDKMVMAIKLEGFSFETADDEDLDAKKIIRNTLFKSVTKMNTSLGFHLIRRKEQVLVQGEFEAGFARQLNDVWKSRHSYRESFVNEIYLTVVVKVDGDKANPLEAVLGGLAKQTDKEYRNNVLKESHKDLKDIINRLMGSLRDYQPKLLGIREKNGAAYSELLEFLGTLINGGKHSKILVPTRDLATYLPTHRLYFGKRAVEIRSPSGKSHFAGALTIKEYSPSTYSSIFDPFLQLPFEFIISQNFTFQNRGAAINSMVLQQRRMASAGDKAISQMQELTVAMDMAQSGHIGFGAHNFSIMVFRDTLDDLERSISQCYSVMVDESITPVREVGTLQATYWAQLPGNDKYIPRPSTIHTLNLASFVSFHNYPTGRPINNHWGNAVTILDTTSGTPYYFNFHARDVGHTTIIGPTGSGKTVLMNFLVAQAQKFNCRVFFFDKDRGAEIFIRALGGVYSVLEPHGKGDFNPLQLEDTPVNRSFIADWLDSLLQATYKAPLTPEELERINHAIDGNFKLPPEKRQLANIVPFLGLEGPGSLANRIRVWHGEEARARLFDNTIDKVDFSKSRVFGFEMGPLLADGMSLSAVLLYIFHRIQISLDGSPTMVVLDEAWALIDNDIFAPKIKDWLKVLRKLNAMVIFATQSVEDIANSDISDTLIQQTATQIFLPNPRGTPEYKETFMLSDREYTLIKRTDPSTRYFLVKQGSEVVVARVDLSGMEEVVAVLSGRAETVAMLDKIRTATGDDPKKWLPEFYEQIRIMNAKKKQ